MLDTIREGIEKTFISNDRYLIFLEGLKNTLVVTVFGIIIGVLIGTVFGILKGTRDRMKPDNRGIAALLYIADKFITVYLSIFRGIPVIVQALIWNYVVFGSSDNVLLVGIITIGINSGAYVTEIIRAGVQGIDIGQNEAGRSLGLSNIQTLRYIILPQAFKNVLPTLVNEFIGLLKETSVLGVISLTEFTRAGDSVRASTYEAFFSLLTTALFYWITVTLITSVANRIERRMRKSDNR